MWTSVGEANRIRGCALERSQYGDHRLQRARWTHCFVLVRESDPARGVPGPRRLELVEKRILLRLGPHGPPVRLEPLAEALEPLVAPLDEALASCGAAVRAQTGGDVRCGDGLSGLLRVEASQGMRSSRSRHAGAEQ